MRHRVSHSSVTRVLRSGLLPARKVGDTWEIEGDPAWPYHRVLPKKRFPQTVQQYASTHKLDVKTVRMACADGRLPCRKLPPTRGGKYWQYEILGEPAIPLVSKRKRNEYLTVNEYADKHGVSVNMVRQACRQGKLRTVCIEDRRTKWMIPDQPWPIKTRQMGDFYSAPRPAKTQSEKEFASFMALLKKRWPGGSGVDLDTVRNAFNLWRDRHRESSQDIIFIPTLQPQEAWL